MKRALLLVSIASWFTMSVLVGALIMRSERTLLLREHDPLVHVSCDGCQLDIYVTPACTWGLGRDEIDVGFAGLRYSQSAYVMGRRFRTLDLTIPAWAWFLATFAAPAALLVWRRRRRKSAESRRGFAVRTDRTTTASAATSA